MKKADQVILGKIYTLDPDRMLVDAMAVCNGRIAYLGSRDIAMKMKGENTEVQDYGDAVIYPGFMDAHTHGVLAGQRIAFQADLSTGKSMQDYVQIMADYIKAHPGRARYMGAGWIYHEEPTAAMLDAVCPDVPVSLNSADGHSIWLNTAAMKYAGIDAAAAGEYGPAMVHVDENGEPTGLLCEGAAFAAGGKFSSTLEEVKEGLLAWQEFAFSQGITAVGDAWVDLTPGCVEAYAQLAAEGKWKLRTYGYALCQKNNTLPDPDQAVPRLKKLAENYNSEYFRIVGLKMFMDGVVEAHTGFLLDEYNDQPGYHGVRNLKDADALTRTIIEANEAGFSTHFHTVGDAASKNVLDSIQAAEESTCLFDARNVLAHLQLIRPEDIQRMADYNVIAAVAPLWATADPHYMQQTIGYVGEDRAWAQYPIKAFEDAGATIVFHTDFPVSPAMNVPKSVFQAIRRCDPELGARTVLDADQAIGSVRALLAMTANVAYMFRQERNLGTFAIGKVANCAVYDRDFIDYTDVKDIVKAKLVATIVDGKAVYQA